MTAPLPTARPIEIEQHGSVRWLWLNRPGQRNAIDPTLIAELEAAIGADGRDTSVLVLTGRGKSFCAGADLGVLLQHAETGTSPMPFITQISRTFNRLEASSLPIVAAVHGHAVAGGLELALAADIVIATESAIIGDGHVRNLLVPGAGASVRLARKLGPSMARWLLLTGELVPASALARSGWLHAVVADDDLCAAAGAAADRLAAHAGQAQAQLKPLLVRADGDALLDAALQAELSVFGRHWDAAPVAGALRSFLRRGGQSASDVQEHARNRPG